MMARAIIHTTHTHAKVNRNVTEMLQLRAARVSAIVRSRLIPITAVHVPRPLAGTCVAYCRSGKASLGRSMTVTSWSLLLRDRLPVFGEKR